MSYEDTARLFTDSTFQGRLRAAVNKEARTKLPSPLSSSVLAQSSTVATFLPWVTSEPGFDVEQSQVTDPMLLSAVQAVWDAVEAQEAGRPQ